MDLYEVEDRLVVIGDSGRCAVWQSGAGQWKETAPTLAAKAVFEGTKLTEAEAAAMFPSADLASVPDLSTGDEEQVDPALLEAVEAAEALLDSGKE
jgi:hypothetical protein